jgi:hypothetical protein
VRDSRELWPIFSASLSCVRTDSTTGRSRTAAAASVLHGLKGDPDDVFAMCVGMLLGCIEWDVEPGEASSRFQASLAAEPS